MTDPDPTPLASSDGAWPARETAAALAGRPWLPWLLLGVWSLCVFFCYQGAEHEQTSTEHYYTNLEIYYGGYGTEYFVYPDRFVACQLETSYLYKNLEALNRRRTSPYTPGYDRAGRLVSASFFPCAVQRWSLGALNLHRSYLLTNTLLWLAAMALSFLLVRRWFPEVVGAPFLAAALAAVYPVFTLMFRSFKVQYAHSVFVLAGLYIVEVLAEAKSTRLLWLMTSFLLLGLFFAGGSELFLLAFMAWCLARHAPRRLFGGCEGATWRSTARLLGVVAAAFLIALLWSKWIREQTQLTGPGLYDMRATLVTNNVAWLKALLSGGDVSDQKLFGYPGWYLFTTFIPELLTSFFRSNPILSLAAPVAFVLSPRARRPILLGLLLLFPAHAPEMLVSWRGSYGYGHAPSMLLFVIGIAGGLGERAQAAGPKGRALALSVVLAAAAWFLANRNDHLDNYYFSWNQLNRVEKIHVYHGTSYSTY